MPNYRKFDFEQKILDKISGERRDEFRIISGLCYLSVRLFPLDSTCSPSRKSGEFIMNDELKSCL